MDKPVQNERGFYKLRYPSALQFIIAAAIWLFIILFSVILQTYSDINPAILTYLSISGCILAAVVSIMMFRKPAGAERKFITSTENLKGSFVYQKIWTLYIGLFSGTFAVATLVNGYFIMTLPSVVIFLLNILAAKTIKHGIRIDDSGNLFYIKTNDEFQIDLNRANEVSLIYIYSEQRAEIRIYFNKEIDLQLPTKLVIKASNLKSVEFKTHLDYRVLGSFLKEKCTTLGFKIKEVNNEYDYSEWTAKK